MLSSIVYLCWFSLVEFSLGSSNFLKMTNDKVFLFECRLISPPHMCGIHHSFFIQSSVIGHPGSICSLAIESKVDISRVTDISSACRVCCIPLSNLQNYTQWLEMLWNGYQPCIQVTWTCTSLMMGIWKHMLAIYMTSLEKILIKSPDPF